MEHRFENYCKDCQNIENYDKALADNFIRWHCHHRRGELISAEELIATGQYYNRPSDELIFLTESEHHFLHQIGKRHTEETKKKISEAAKGKPKSDEHKKKISEGHKGVYPSEETKKKMSESHKGNKASKGMHWYNNSKINKLCFECPEGFVPGRLKRK